MKGLRVGFIKSMGIEPVKGDGFINDMCICDEFNPFNAEHRESMLRNDTVITSFAPRKNTGEQPCGGDVYVIATVRRSRDWFNLARRCAWDIEGDDNGYIITWKPDLESLIKMQAEHDKAATEQPKPEQLIYTHEIALTHGKPEADMLCRVEHGVALDDDIKINTVTFKFETDSEICVLDKDGHIDAIDKEWFIAFHPISTKKELEIAKEKQIDRLLAMVDFIGGDTTDNRARLEYLQYNNELPEIILPLEK